MCPRLALREQEPRYAWSLSKGPSRHQLSVLSQGGFMEKVAGELAI